MNVHRLRAIPAIAFEPEEGARLRRRTSESGRASRAEGADHGSPPWSQDIYNVQMMTRVAVTLVEVMFRDMKAMSDLLDVNLRAHTHLDELTHQIYQIQSAADALQPN